MTCEAMARDGVPSDMGERVGTTGHGYRILDMIWMLDDGVEEPSGLNAC